MDEEQNQYTIEDLQLSLEIYEIESEKKLEQLKQLFEQKGSLDLAKVFYEERSSIQIKFQNIICDLIEFLVKQEVPSTEKLRKMFYRVLENPLLLLFKVSRFQIFSLRLEGFDIEITPIEAIQQLGKGLSLNIDSYLQLYKNGIQQNDGQQYKSWSSFIAQSTLNLVKDKIFVMYSYLRKGAALLKKKMEDKTKIVEIFNNMQQKLMPILLQNQDTKMIKELSILNYEIYELENSFDVLNFYLAIPLKQKFMTIFEDFERLATKAKQASNYDIFILIFVKYSKQIMEKINIEGIDPCYSTYIENGLIAILEMWGCRICHYNEFCELFIILFNLHPHEIQILQLCLKHTPNLQKEDIVLLRTNFKLQLANRHSQLLSLMKQKKLQELNVFLSSFYHKILYNLDFKELEREKIINLLTLINGNSTLLELFQVTQKAFRQWNHTIDFTHSHKFLSSQFAYPKLDDEKVMESFKLLTNLCVLQQKNFESYYEGLIKAGTIGKALLGFSQYLNTKDQCKELLQKQYVHKYFLESFNFLKKCMNPSTDAEGFIKVYGDLSKNIKEKQTKQKIEKNILSYIKDNFEHFKLVQCLSVMISLKTISCEQIIDVYMSEVSQFNSQINNFRFFDLKEEDIEKVTKKEGQFLQKNGVVRNGILQPKQTGIFKLTDLQIMTNPIQFQKVMDNYYFHLQPNSKKFLQYCCSIWKDSQENNEYETELIKTLIKKYPISVPILSSVRLQMQSTNLRFIEYLCEMLTKRKGASQLINSIVQTRCIRYRNGKDYVQEEISPMVVKNLIKNINASESEQRSVKSIQLLSKVFQRANLKQFKIDILQKVIEKIKYMLKKTQNPQFAQKLSFSHERMLTTFFSKKQAQMKRKGLSERFKKLIWEDVRNYSSLNSDGQKQLTDSKVPDQIIITPFTISQDFNLLEYKNKTKTKKVEPKINEKDNELVSFEDIRKNKVECINDQITESRMRASEKQKEVDISSAKYSLFEYLGKDNVEELCKKQNITFMKEQSKVNEDDAQEQNKSLIQFYLKELDIPIINTVTILKCLVAILSEPQNSQVQLSSLWTNSKNLQHFYMDLLTVFEFAFLPEDQRNPQKSEEIDKIVELVKLDSTKAIKKVMRIFSKLGYSNIWAESLNMYWINFPIRKQLGFNNKSEESFLSILLRNTLQKDQFRQSLALFLGSLFETRDNQNALMYKVSMDKSLMNVIMKSLSIPHLDKISLLFHSNFNNLRLYTDQLHEGMKALNMASKNRSYNQYVKLSQEVDEEEFYGPMKLFKENFSFFIRIQKEGYIFKKNEEIKLTLDRIKNIVRGASEKENVSQKVDEILLDHISEIKQLQSAMANRVKSFYLATKLRDLSYQNSLMINVMHSTMKNKGKACEQILNQIQKVQLFSLMNRMYNELITFEDDWRNLQKYSSKNIPDQNYIENQVNICTTRRFSHSMNQIYEKSDLQFDQVLQRCYDALKVFFSTEQGVVWLNKLEIFPAFLVKSFINHEKSQNLCESILKRMRESSANYQFKVQDLITDLVKGFRLAPRQSFAGKLISINYKGKTCSPVSILPNVVQFLLNNETLVKIKQSGFIILNKFKSSEATLEELQVLGKIIAYAILNNQNINVPLHPSIIAALNFNICHIDYLLDVNFKVWEELKGILATADSAKLALNFSHNFQSIETLKEERVQLVDKGSSKKVNNQNRQQFCDLVCSYILYEQIRPQITRLLQSIISIIPKEYLSCRSARSILGLFYEGDKIKRVLDDYMRKIGVVYPQTIVYKGKRIENLKDFQNVEWFQEIILSSPKLQSKFWKDESNLLLFTVLSSKGSVQKIENTFVIHHFANKQEMKKALEQM